MLYTISEKTIGEIAAEKPSSIRVFESVGIDYCCGGKRPVSEACNRAGISVEQLNELLASAERDTHTPDTEGWSDAPLLSLMAHIIGKHHSYVRREIPRLNAMLQRVVTKHGAKNPQVAEIRDLFAAIGEELTTHMLKEEQILFPFIQSTEQAIRENRPLPKAPFGSVAKPIASMVADHDDAGLLLARIRELSNDYTPPAGACPTFCALYQGLLEFEQDLHKHVHLENNILFLRAVALENSGSQA